MSTTKPPTGTKAAGRRLWKSITDEFDLDEHELQLLVQACRTADLCDDLQTVLNREGTMTAGRVHPAAVELRHQRLTLARLVVALRVPLGAEDDQAPQRTQRRGTRGVYGIKGGAS